MNLPNRSKWIKPVISKVFITLLFILMILFIFFQSFQSGEASSSLSTDFTHILQGWITTLGLNLTLQEEWVRIAAHGFEFFLLGCITADAIWIYRNPITTALFRNVVVFIPFIDEGIQSFVPGRAFQWTDLLIDFAGLLLGMLVIVQCKKTRIKRNLEKI